MKNLDYDLPKAIKAHRAGRIAEAAAGYGAVLRAQPNQPDANHNLGLIRVAEDDLVTATKLFKKAVTLDPKKEQFWLSYINSLIQAQKLEKARIALRKARKHGISNAIESKINQSLQLEKHIVSRQGRPTEAEINSLVFQYQNSTSSSKLHAQAFTKSEIARLEGSCRNFMVRAARRCLGLSNWPRKLPIRAKQSIAQVILRGLEASSDITI